MSKENVAEMTLEELAQFVDRRIQSTMALKQDKRPIQETLAILDRHRITLPPGAKSALEMLREDRDA